METEREPTYQDILEYCRDAGLLGKISTNKFYEYYKGKWFYKGVLINWKEKLQQWAARQTSPVTLSAEEYRLLNESKAQHPPTIVENINSLLGKFQAEDGFATGTMNYLSWALAQI